MTRHTRSVSSSGHQYPVSQQHIPIAASTMLNTQRLSMPANYYPVPSNASQYHLAPQPAHHQHQQHQQQEVQHPHQSVAAYDQFLDTTVVLPTSHRPSSGAWSPQDDQQLIQARAQGLNWNQIKNTYFPSKTSNACRKRHERLAERRDSDDWDNVKLQRLAKEYMTMRKEIWSELASRTGEKWNIVEQKCMSNGLKNLQSAARTAARQERIRNGQGIQGTSGASDPHLSGYDDDSGISGIGLTPVDELDASYSSPETTASRGSSSSRHGGTNSTSSSTAGYPSHHYRHSHHQQQQQHHGNHPQMQSNMHMQVLAGTGAHAVGYNTSYHGSHGYSSSVSSSASGHHGYSDPVSSQSPSPYMTGQRLSSADMHIGSLINRPGGGGA